MMRKLLSNPRITKKDALLLAQELETGRGGLAKLAVKKPWIVEASKRILRRRLPGKRVTVYRALRMVPGKRIRKEKIVSTTLNPMVALQILKETGAYWTLTKLIVPKEVLFRYRGSIDRVIAYVPGLIHIFMGKFAPGTLAKLRFRRRDYSMTNALSVFTAAEDEEEVIFDATGLKPTTLKLDHPLKLRFAIDVLEGTFRTGPQYIEHRKKARWYETDPKSAARRYEREARKLRKYFK